MRRPLVLPAVLTAVLLAAPAGCASAPDPLFDDETGADVGCLVHQQGAPGPRYLDPARRETGAVLDLMRYYTAHGTKPFCDGAPAGDADRAWAQVYVDLGGPAENVPA